MGQGVGFGPEAGMDQAIAEKLQAMAEEAQDIDQEYQFDRWSTRIHQFLTTALGADEANHFQTLVSPHWPDTVALRRGYLEALLAKDAGRRVGPMPTFEDKAKSLVATAAQVARMQNAEPIATVLEQSSASLILTGAEDEGPTTYYTLMLEVPIRVYAQIEEDRDALEQIIAKRLQPIVRPYTYNWISQVIISPEMVGESRPALPTPELGGAPEEAPSFWQPGFFRLFISHTSANKDAAHNLKNSLTKYHVVSFVAHEDIDPTKEWQAEIEPALRTTDALTAIITPDFYESKWCDQEVGIAFGRGKLVIPLCKGADPHGFLGKYQGLQTKGMAVPGVAEDLVDILIGHTLTAQRMADALVEKLATSKTYDNARVALTMLERFPHLNSLQMAKLVESIAANDQVRDSRGAPERIRKLVEKVGKTGPV
jgi:hypothetical protein